MNSFIVNKKKRDISVSCNEPYRFVINEDVIIVNERLYIKFNNEAIYVHYVEWEEYKLHENESIILNEFLVINCRNDIIIYCYKK